MYFNTVIETERMLLKGWDQQSYDDLFLNHENEDIKKILGITLDCDLDIQRNRYNTGMSSYNSTIQTFQLISKLDNSVLGWCGYHSWSKQHRRAEIFYNLKLEENKRQKLMTEAISPIIRYGKDVMKLRRIEGFVAVNNPASYLLLEKFGFTKEAKVKYRYDFGDNVEWDYMYSLIFED